MALVKRECKGCGAPLPEHSTTCEYCGSTHDNVTVAVALQMDPRHARGGGRISNVMTSDLSIRKMHAAAVIGAQFTGVIQTMRTTADEEYDSYYDGTSMRTVRVR